ncbi:MAG: IPT/TIG domain-containing protein, partial [bacterium]
MKRASVIVVSLLCVCILLTPLTSNAWTVMKVYGNPAGTWTGADGVGLTLASGVWRTSIQKTDASGDWYFRFYSSDGGDRHFGPNPAEGGDALVSTPGTYTCAEGSSFALYLNAMQNYHYTFSADDATSLDIGCQVTTNTPVSISGVSDNHNFITGGVVAVSITTSAQPCDGEDVYVRYTTNGWVSSAFVKATGSGTSWTADIPGQVAATPVTYYILTTTYATPTHAGADMQTLAYGNNGGANYSYSQPPNIVAQVTFEDYASAVALTGQSAPTDVGLSGTWTAQATATVSNEVLVYSKGDVRIEGGTNALYLKCDGSSDVQSRALSSALAPGANVVRYVAFLFRCNGTFTANTRTHVALDTSASTTGDALTCGVMGNSTSNNYARAGAAELWSETQPVADQVYYYVAKYEAGASGWTNVTVFRNPTNTAAEQAELIYSTPCTAWNFSPTFLLVRNYGGTAENYFIDQITVGESWGDVVYSDSETPASDMMIVGTNGVSIADGVAFDTANGTAFYPTLPGSSVTNILGITNNGAASLNISSFTTNGADAASFEIAGIPASVDIGTVSNFSVVYSPVAVGTHTATVVFVTDIPSTTFALNLGGAAYQLSTNIGPSAGGNSLTITNGLLGNGSDITNVLVGGVAATITGQGENWVTIALPANTPGMKDMVIQSTSVGDTTLPGAYTVNPAGAIGGTIYGPSVWTNLGSGMNDSVSCLAHDGTNLYAGGAFTTAGGVAANRVAKWNGARWSSLGSGMDIVVYVVAPVWTHLYAGGTFTTAGGVAASCIAKWNGSSWTNLGSGISGGMEVSVYALAHDGTNLYVGGGFTTAGGVAASCIAKWDGSSWTNLGSGMSDIVFALVHDGTTLYAGGVVTTAGGVAANRIAKWDG